MFRSPLSSGSAVRLLLPLGLFVWAVTRLVTGDGGGTEIGLALAMGVVLGRQLPGRTRRGSASDLPSLAAEGGLEAIGSPGPLLLFKHSTTCPISSVAAREVVRFAAEHPEIPVRRIFVIEERPLSNGVAERTRVLHESPQVIYLEGGEVRGCLSHGGVKRSALEAWFADAETLAR